METFSEETRIKVHEAYNGYCGFLGCSKEGIDFCHRKENTETNRKLYPHFIQSVFNCVLGCRDCHTERNHQIKITDRQAQLYENELNDS